jgi:hypothetical protein
MKGGRRLLGVRAPGRRGSHGDDLSARRKRIARTGLVRKQLGRQDFQREKRRLGPWPGCGLGCGAEEWTQGAEARPAEKETEEEGIGR